MKGGEIVLTNVGKKMFSRNNYYITEKVQNLVKMENLRVKFIFTERKEKKRIASIQ